MRLFAIVLCGCGRLGFDATVDASIADADLRACATRIPDLTAWFPFEGNTDDVVTAARSALQNGNPTFDTGHDGQGIVLDGIDDRVDLPAALAVNDYSFAFWVRTTDVGTGVSGDLWFEGKSLLDAEVCGAPATGDFGIALIDGGHVNSSVLTMISTETINDDAWHHLVLTRSISPNEEFLYLDGEEIARDTGFAVPHTEIPFIGLGNNSCRINGDNNFAGRVDEVVSYDRAITPAEVTGLFECVEP